MPELWFLFALATAVMWTAYGLLSRVLAQKSESPLALTIPYGIYAGLFALIPLLWEPWTFGTLSVAVLGATFIATVLFAVYDIFQFYGRRHLEASQSTILFQVAPIATFIVAVLVLNESVTLLKIGAIALIVFGNIIALYKRGSAIVWRGVFFILLAAVGSGAAYVADKFAVAHYPVPLYAAITYFVPIIYCFLIYVAKREPLSVIVSELRRGGWRLPVLSAVGVLGYYLALKAFLLTEVSNVVPVLYFSTILTALSGILILKERSGITQKLIGAFLAVAGVILLQTA